MVTDIFHYLIMKYISVPVVGICLARQSLVSPRGPHFPSTPGDVVDGVFVVADLDVISRAASARSHPAASDARSQVYPGYAPRMSGQYLSSIRPFPMGGERAFESLIYKYSHSHLGLTPPGKGKDPQGPPMDSPGPLTRYLMRGLLGCRRGTAKRSRNF